MKGIIVHMLCFAIKLNRNGKVCCLSFKSHCSYLHSLLRNVHTTKLGFLSISEGLVVKLHILTTNKIWRRTKGLLAMQNPEMKLWSYIARDKYNKHFAFVETKRNLCLIEYESCFLFGHYLLIIIMQTCIELDA